MGLTYECLRDFIKPIPVRESPFLSMCEEKPEIILKTTKITLSKQDTFVCPMFSSFLRSSDVKIPEVEQLWGHSSQSNLAWRKAIAKYHRTISYSINEEAFALAETWIYELVRPLVGSTRPFSFPEVLRESTLGASPGPECRHLVATKAEFIDHPYCKSRLADYLASSFQPGGLFSLWGAQLKNELRLMEKVDEDKTRLFIMAPTEHFIASQTLSLDFNLHLIKKAQTLSSPVLIGMPTTGTFFNQLALELEPYDFKVAADVAGYDTSVSEELLQMCARLRYRCMHSSYHSFELLTQFANVYREVIHTPVVLPDGTVVIFPHHPSGTGNTGMDNSLILLFLIMYIWLINGGSTDFSLFRRVVQARVFGDDSLIASLNKYLDQLGPEALSTGFASMGFAVEFSPALEFLGHFIVWDDGMSSYIPVFPYHKVLASLCYQGSHDIQSLITKPFSLRTLAWADERSWFLLEAYCQWLFDRYPEHRQFMMPMWKTREEVQQIQCVGVLKRSAHTKLNNSFVVNQHSPMPRKNQQNKSTNSNPAPRRNQPPARAPATTVIVQAPPSKPQGGARNPRKRRNRNRNKGIAGANRNNIGAIELYARSLMDPAQYHDARVPIGGRHPTATNWSRRIVDVKAYKDATTNSGRFAISMAPHLGDTSDPSLYKMAMVRTDQPWPADFTLANNFVSMYGGTDIRLDSNNRILTQPPGGLIMLQQGGASVSGASPLGTAPVAAPNTYGLNYQYTIPTTSQIQLPDGQYCVKLEVGNNTTANSFVGNNIIFAMANCTVDTLENGFQNNVVVGGTADTTFIVAVMSSGNIQGGFLFEAQAAHVDFCNVIISPCCTTTTLAGAPFPLPATGGALQQYRLVSMCAHFTNTQNVLQKGGRVAAALVDGQSAKNFFQNTSNMQGGPLNALNGIMQIEGARDFEAALGCHIWWKPDDSQDYNLLDPVSRLNEPSPHMIICGQVAWPDATGLDTEYTIGRLELDCNYEFITIDTTMPVKSINGSQAYVDAALQVINSFPVVTENPGHGKVLDAFERVANNVWNAGKKTVGFVKDNWSTIAAIGKGVATLGSFV